MDKQDVWDRELLSGWTNDTYIIEVATAFLNEVKPELVSDSGFIEEGKKFREFFVPLGLKRCLDVNASSSAREPIFRGWGRTRVFIASRCERLSNCLWSGKYTEQELLDSIDAFTWRKHGKAIQQAMSKKHDKKRSGTIEVSIKARGLSNRNWNTVK
jgi:hypothetical protein